MRIFKIALFSAGIACALLGAADADAHRGRGRVGVGIWLGGPIFPYYSYPRYYYPPAYYPPAYYPPAYYPPTVASPAPASPPVYIEQNPPPSSASSASAESAGASWYYCRDSQTYYPYVQQCASPWQQVVPQTAPPGPQSGLAAPAQVPRT